MNGSFGLVEKINYKDISLKETLEGGLFSTVAKAKFQGQTVAVKELLNERESKYFLDQVNTLIGVSHTNIVQLYGVCPDPVCIIMELADYGSLERAIHGSSYVDYNHSQALIWAQQCADALTYLHSKKPSPVIYRHLKPSNLLLFDGGETLKLGDFSTSSMNSIPWMAPELFNGEKCTDKCDVYSWAVILWELFTRTKPHRGYSSPFLIMKAVSSGVRPPIDEGWIPELKTIIISCWQQDPGLRPSMKEISEHVRSLIHYCFLIKRRDLNWSEEDTQHVDQCVPTEVAMEVCAAEKQLDAKAKKRKPMMQQCTPCSIDDTQMYPKRRRQEQHLPYDAT